MKQDLHCGSKTRRGNRKIDITGQKFHMLTVVKPTDKRDRNGSAIWVCRCDCGNEIEISYEDLKYSKIMSCGCYRKNRAKNLSENYLTHVAGTSVNYLEKAKKRTDNKTGVKGVFFFRGKYIAEINFQGKCYRLGKFEELADAIDARKEAERQLHHDFLEHYNKWKKRAEKDPEWAKENPVSVRVEKLQIGGLSVVMYPDMN